MELVVARTDHIPDDLVRDFDLYNLPGVSGGYCDDIHAVWKKVQDRYPDVFWTPRNGGHWMLMRYREMVEITTKPDSFSSTEPFVPKGIIPHTGPSQLDAPEHQPFRRLVAQAFTPEKLKQASVRARAVASALVDEIRPRGECDFMHDFIGLMPIITFLNLLELPESDAPFLHDLASRMVPGQPGMEQAQADANDYIIGLIADREKRNANDFVSILVRAKVMDRALTEVERLNVVRLVVTGGLDTVINMTSFATTYFARHPAVQHDLRNDPESYDGAVHEITRMFGTTNLGRVAREDLELGGVKIRAGEQVIAAFPLSGLDERANPDPMTFDARRSGGRHVNFGSGPHTCLGALLARREIQIYLEEWIAKMPEFRIAEGTGPRMSSGIINTMRDLKLEWKPS